MAKGTLKWILYLIAAILLLLGLIFIISTVNFPWANIEGGIFISVAIILIYFSREKKTMEIKQTLEISGTPKVKEVKCPNCGANLDPKTIQVIDGRPYMTCNYCGNRFELTEEPKW